MFSSAGKQLDPAGKADLRFPYAFSPLPQEATVVPIQEENDSNTCSNSDGSAYRLLKDITYYAGLLACIAVLLYRGYRYSIEIHFVYPSPLLETNSLTISNFNISDSKLEGIWNVSLAFGHSLDDFAEVTYYNLFAGSIYYKHVGNVHARNFLAKVNPITFYVRQKEITRVHLDFANTSLEAEQPGKEHVIEDINKEAENGVLHFSIDIMFRAEFKKWGQKWSGPDPFRVSRYCWDLMAGIDRVTGKGRLINAMAVYCE